uniref:Uncharacterized protein n=1 Tax=Nelumbo nucifera TaxID=4432 RepID=A0A822ZBM4_NELNU|nr:TPA_asm: hypothetical protein HUJ06_016253 [Nelumbo nucifera]
MAPENSNASKVAFQYDLVMLAFCFGGKRGRIRSLRPWQ